MNQVAFVSAAILLVVSLVLLVPTLALFVECVAALLPKRKTAWKAMLPRPKLAVLVPAHNEALGIQATLETILPELTETDLLLVIADNCDDETALIAKEAGATVVERHDLQRRGKGYALDFGLGFLAENPPEVVIIIDADCTIVPGSLEKIARLSITHCRPVQATYLLTQPTHPKPKDAVSSLAFTVKNLVRPVGLTNLGLPCLLTGTGMALPWSVIRTTSLASGNLVEDMQLALDLAIAGYPPTFCAEARVTGALPQQNRAAKSQRTRWEHGHLKTLMTQVPRLLKAAIQRKRLDLAVIALDLCIPPLSLLVMLWLATTGIALVAGFLSVSTLPVFVLAFEGLLITVAILGAWAKFCRAELPAQVLLAIPLYILWKIPLYLSFLIKPQTKWVRTERDVVNVPKS